MGAAPLTNSSIPRKSMSWPGSCWRRVTEWKDDGVGWQAGLVLTSGFAAHSVEQVRSLPMSSKHRDIINHLDVS